MEAHLCIQDEHGLCLECDRPMSQVERNNKLKANNAKKGLRQVTVWIPAIKAEELKAMAAKWREGL